MFDDILYRISFLTKLGLWENYLRQRLENKYIFSELKDFRVFIYSFCLDIDLILKKDFFMLIDRHNI